MTSTEALRLWGKVTELADQLSDSEESVALRITSPTLQLDLAWRLGIGKRFEALLEDARELATRVGDLRSLSLLEMLGPGRAGQVFNGGFVDCGLGKGDRLADPERQSRSLCRGGADRGLRSDVRRPTGRVRAQARPGAGDRRR